MLWQHHFRFQLVCAAQRCIEIVRLEPQKKPVAIRPVVRVSDRTVVMLDFEAVQLKDQKAIQDEALVMRSSVRALAAEQLLVPAAARLDVDHGDEGLRTHWR